MRIAIAEDQAADSRCLATDISRWADEHNIPLVPLPDIYESGEGLLSHFSKGSYDIIFLDIFMDGIDGMETARRIRKADSECRLVFITSTKEYAIDSYDVDSSWYLLKPYNYQKLSQALARCGAEFIEQGQFFTVPGKYGDQKLLLHQVTWTEYINRQICVHLKNGEEQYVRMRQNEFAGMLLSYPYFCDCMKGILVNLEFVEKIQENCLKLKDGSLLPISRLKYRDVREKFLDYSYQNIRGQAAYAD